MKNRNFKSCPLKYPRMLEALHDYINRFPKGQSLFGGKSRRQIYTYPNYLVVVYETKQNINLEVV